MLLLNRGRARAQWQPMLARVMMGLCVVAAVSSCTANVPSTLLGPQESCLPHAGANGESSMGATPLDIVQIPGNWTMVWDDEFNQPNGSGPDPAKWTSDPGPGDVTTDHELEYYTSSIHNAFIQDGSLVISARRESYGGMNYTSARLTTMNKGDWKYGRVDVRAKLPCGQGMWPAIWMLPTDNVYGDWPKSGEIDIMENLGNNTKLIYGTAIWGENHTTSQGTYSLPQNGSFAENYHVFSMVWEPGVIQLYVDGHLYQTTNQGKPFDQRFNLILNLAVGGIWPGPPNASTVFPQYFSIDYVRVFQ